MNGAIAIFVKTPGFSPVKTRLAVKLGQQAAEAFHLASARTVKTVVQAAGKLETIRGYFAVAEQAALAHNYWQDLPCLWQGEGGLGERMAQVYQTLLKSHDFVLLVGADSPQMTVSELLKASAWLARDEHARLAFGPSVDGGFWLFGGNVSVPHTLWTEVAYSAADTGAQFFNKVGQLGEIRILASLCDVDEVEDLLSLREALLKLAELLPEQRELLRFLDALPLNFSQH
ncbi:MAG: glycosyltransferase [Methylococcales bacterium]|nr:glycosyltransferase [Methylococcales bacterium]